MYKNLDILRVYNLMGLDTHMALWYHHHQQDAKHFHHLRKFPLVTLVCVVRTLTVTSSLLSDLHRSIPYC